METTKGIANNINKVQHGMEQRQTPVTMDDIMDTIKLVSNGRPTKQKPFIFIKGHCFVDGKDMGAHSLKNDGENIYVFINGEDKKVDPEELFVNDTLKFIE